MLLNTWLEAHIRPASREWITYLLLKATGQYKRTKGKKAPRKPRTLTARETFVSEGIKAPGGLAAIKLCADRDEPISEELAGGLLTAVGAIRSFSDNLNTEEQYESVIRAAIPHMKDEIHIAIAHTLLATQFDFSNFAISNLDAARMFVEVKAPRVQILAMFASMISYMYPQLVNIQ